MLSPTLAISLYRVAPVVFTSNVLVIGVESFIHLRPFASLPSASIKSAPSPSSNVLAHLFSGFFYSGFATLMTNLTGAVAASSYAAYLAPEGPARTLSIAAAALSAAHLVFVPWIAPYCRDACDQTRPEQDVQAAVKGWLGVHRVRIWVDVAAVVCAVCALTV